MHYDELLDAQLSVQSDYHHRGGSARRHLSPNSSAPPDLLRPDADDVDDGTSDDGGYDGGGPLYSRRSTAGDVTVDTDDGTLRSAGQETVNRRVSLFVTDESLRRRSKVDRRRKSSFGRAAWSMDDKERKVEIFYWFC